MSEEQGKAIRQLDAGRMEQREQRMVDYFVVVEEGTTRKEMKNPAFWAHVAHKLKPYFKINIACDDGTFYAEGLVLQVDRTWAIVHILEWHDLTTKDVAQSQAAAAEMGDSADGFEIKHRGEHRKWTVIRKSDREAVKEGLATKAEALIWLAEHLKAAA